MTDRRRTAVGARLMAFGASAGATLALMGGMAAAADDAGTAISPPESATGAPPQPNPTTAPPTSSSHAS